MEAYTQALVVILATFLAINLVLWVFVLIKALQILKTIKRITDKAESLADKAEHVGSFFKKTGGVAAIGKVLLGVINGVRQRKSKIREERDR